MKNYVTTKELIKIYSVPQQTVEMILKRHKIDTYKSKRGLAINLKDFHKAYTLTYNPSLFSYTEEKHFCNEKIPECPKFADFESLFFCIFKKPYKAPNKKEVLNNNFLFNERTQ